MTLLRTEATDQYNKIHVLNVRMSCILNVPITRALLSQSFTTLIRYQKVHHNRVDF